MALATRLCALAPRLRTRAGRGKPNTPRRVGHDDRDVIGASTPMPGVAVGIPRLAEQAVPSGHLLLDGDHRDRQRLEGMRVEPLIEVRMTPSLE